MREAGGAGGERAVVTDFGLARRAASVDVPLSGAGESRNEYAVGTPAYMAPEQVEGGPLSPATDVYAFGVVLFELLTGGRPFAGDTPLEVMLKRLREAPASPRSLVRDLDPRWEAAVLRCLARDPADRFAGVGDVLRALRGEPVALGRTGRRRRLLALALVPLALAPAWWAWRSLPSAAPAPAAAATPAVPARRAVAVLAFRNLAGGTDVAWLSTALAEMLSSELAAGESLRLVPGETLGRLRADLRLGEGDSLAADTLRRLRGLCGADAVVVGSFVALGPSGAGQLRLDVRLQDAQAGEIVASVSENGSQAELFELVARVGLRLRQRLGAGPVAPSQAESARTALPGDPEAARLYAQGLERLRLLDARGARELLDRAAAREPRHALTHAALAAAWTSLGYETRAADEARRAFELSEGLPRAERLAIEARWRESTHDYPQAVAIYESLARFYPDDLGYGLRLASSLDSAGRGQEALAVYDRLRRLPEPAGSDPRIDLEEASVARFQSDTRRAVDAARRAAARAEALGARHMLARARFEEGSALQNLGELDAALAALEAGRALFEQAGDRRGVASALTNASLIHANRGDLALARRLSEQALELYRSIGSRSGEALLQGNLGNFLYFQGDLAGARRQWERTLPLHREIGDKNGVARMLTNIAAARGELGDLAGAQSTLEQALVAWREVGQKNGIAATLADLGKALHQQGELKRAAECLAEALAIFGEIGDKTYAAAAWHDQGDLLVTRGDLAAGRRSYEQARRLREELGEKVTASATRVALADLALEEGRGQEAEQAARVEAALMAAEKQAAVEGAAWRVVARALLARGQAAEALATAERAAQLVAGGQGRAASAAVAVVRAQARAAHGDARGAERELRALLAAPGSLPLGLRYEVRLELARLRGAAGRNDLQALTSEAGERGFALVAARGQALLGEPLPATAATRR